VKKASCRRSKLPRLNSAKVAAGIYDAMDALDRYLSQSELGESLLHLVRLRASQINCCAYCLDMQWKDLRLMGKRSSGCTHWTPGAKARTTRVANALPWPGRRQLTLIANGHVPDTVHEEVRPHFSEKESSDLTLALAAINAWNRLSIAARIVPSAPSSGETAIVRLPSR